MIAEKNADSFAEGIESLLSANAKAWMEDAGAWIREHPTEAALLGMAGGFLVGMTGAGRIYAGARALRSMPFVSQFVLGSVAKNFFMKRDAGEDRAVH